MYKFVDTNEISAGVLLPAEAMQINGEYIENLITGYRTLTVKGREALSPELSTYETGIRDGAGFLSKRYPARTITVKYQLICKTPEEFREAYNKLGSILDVNNAELIFNDEQDKFFIGTPSSIEEVDTGKISVIGEFEILCTDPFKYSVVEYEAAPDLEESSVLVDYNGTYKAFPILEAEFFKESDISEDGETEVALTGSGDCGYVGFFNEREKIIQLGDPEETDGDSAAFPKSQTLLNSVFSTSSVLGSAVGSLWKINSGLTSSSAVVQDGSWKNAIASYSAHNVINASPTSQFLFLRAWSTQGNPQIRYDVYASASNRTATSVKVKIVVKSSLEGANHLLGNGYSVNANISIKGVSKNIVLKADMGARWVSGKTYTTSTTLTINGLNANTTYLDNIAFSVETNSSYNTGKLPSTACNNLPISRYSVTTVYDSQTYYLTPDSYGSGNDWHGPSITRVLPADENGDTGATDFTLSYAQKLCIGSGSSATNQKGQFQVMLTSGSGTSRRVIAGVNVFKGGKGKTATLRLYVNGEHYDQTIDLSYNNQYFKPENATTITKEGQKLTFNVCGIIKTYNNIELADVAVNEITLTCAKFGNDTALSYNGICWVKFVKNNCETWKDIPNKFSANDIVAADCKTGKILLNGVNTPALGVLGNDWEGFYLTPGLNQIGFAYSDWVTADYAPKIKVRYREVFL